MSLDISLFFVVDTGNGTEEFTVFDRNYTHNIVAMARVAGVYDCVWRPEENGYDIAEQLVQPLSEGIAKMKRDPEFYKTLDPPNGWGSYSTFLAFLEDYLEACKQYPLAKINACR